MESPEPDTAVHDPHSNRVRLTIDNWIALVGLIVTITGGLYFAISSRFSEIEDRLDTHEIRLTKREANAFTAQDANGLSNNITRLSIELAQLQRSFEKQGDTNDAIDTQLDDIQDRLRVSPKDVLAIAKENQSILIGLLRKLNLPVDQQSRPNH